MQFEWDERKSLSNLAKHGVGFSRVGDFDWERAIILPDKRRDYGESRFRAFGMLGGRPHVVAFAMRGNIYRIINLRRARMKELKRYVSEKA